MVAHSFVIAAAAVGRFLVTHIVVLGGVVQASRVGQKLVKRNILLTFYEFFTVTDFVLFDANHRQANNNGNQSLYLQYSSLAPLY
jgi:hypothetical protein